MNFRYRLRRLISLKRTTQAQQKTCCSVTRKSQNIYTVRRSKRNMECKKQVNPLMIEDGGKRHYIAIKNISRFLSKLNGGTRRAYHFCMNCLNGFRTVSARDKHYECCSSNDHVKVTMPAEKEK